MMMDSCPNNSADRGEQVEQDDLQRPHPPGVCTSTDSQQSSSVEDREHLQVYLRIRPFTSAESSNGESQDCVSMETPDTVLLKPPSLSLSVRLSADRSLPQTGQRFTFSQVYGPDTTQRELFAGTVKDLVKDVLEGGNSLVFTYGVTNAGKTFTFLGPDADAGILPRSLALIFNTIDEQVFPGMSIKPHRCREFVHLSREQQAEEVLFKRSLFKQLKETERINSSILNSTNRTLLEAPSVLEASAAAEDRLDLEVDAHTKFSVWVSFCEIYNENIHDLLEAAPSAAPRRTVLRLSQDVKGNAFVKDLRWVQVTSAEEAYKVMKLGKKNQSFSSTRLNQLSSRSHSIFSIRILRIEDVGTPRVHTVSELCLCDLAGSERCAKTQNKGERLKEAGNINTSLLILGKCINALRHNQQAKLLQHVPFRESKLTHYLQSFFCGRGKACMIVNINQCASMYDETLNVLKFSAVAQKVVVLPRPPPVLPHRSTSDASFVTRGSSRRSSLNGWESSLEDVQEDVDDEEDGLADVTVDQTCDEEDGDEEEDKVIMSKKTQQRQVALSKQLQLQLKKERAENLLMEARVREEISREFSELFSEMQNDYNDRLAREREILEERAERRLEIFKNLIDNMSRTGPDAQVMDKSLDSFSSDLAGIKEATEAAHRHLGSGRTGRRSDVSDAVEELERKVLELNEHRRRAEEQTAGKHSDDTSGEEDKEKRRLLLQLQEKSSLILQLQKQVEELHKGAEPGSQLQEVLTALEEEKKAREDALTALQYQTMGKEEALASLQEERKAREEMVATLMELRRSREEVEASLKEQRRDKEKAKAALEEERRSREEALAALEEARSTLESEKEERGKRQQEAEALQQEVRELTAKLKAAEHQVTGEAERAEQALVQLQAAQKHLDQQSKEIQEKTVQIQTLTLEAEGLRQELQRPAATSDGVSDELREEVSELRKNLSEEKQNIENNRRQVLELERELQQAKEQLVHKQQLEELNQKLQQQEEASQGQIEELRKKLQEQEETSQQPLDELRSKLEHQEVVSRGEVDHLKAKLEEQTQASEKQLEEVNEKLQEERVRSQQLLEELQNKLTEQKETSDRLLEDLKQKFSEQEKSAEQLKTELEEAKGSSSRKEEELRKMNSDLQTEVASLRATVSNVEEMKEAQKASSEVEEVSAEKEAELQKKLLEAEAQVKTLQKNLREAQERREEEESQAAQEARRREAERRRELLAVAHEAIAQKEEELEKRAAEINRLKENSKQDAEKVKSLGIDLQRKEEDTSDLREKLADYKKQIQQVQKEISARRDEEKVLKQKLSDVEKTKKQLQSDVASRDRTIQQLKLEQSPEARSDQSLQLYQQSCKDLEAKQRLIDDMRLALTEQEETQEEMEKVLEEKLDLIQELSSEVDKLKALLLQQDRGHSATCTVDSQSDDLKLAKQEAARAQESLKLCTDKHQAERKKWLEEKLSLIGQAKEAEDKRNQDMRKFADDRERYTRQQSQLESLTSQLAEKDQTMGRWRTDRDALVAALEVQLQKLLSSQAEKDKLIQELQQSSNTQTPPPEGGGEVVVNELRAALQEREVEIQRLKEELKAATEAQVRSSESPDTEAGKPQSETLSRKSAGRRDTRVSVSSQGSAGCPSVLDSSEISTENGRTSRFPRPELEISFSPLQPNRMALRRQGEESAVTVKITRSARKRKSGEMEKSHIFRRTKRRTQHQEEVEAENRRNTRTKVTPKMTPHQEESSSPAGRHDSHSSIRSRKEGTLQKIGEFLQSSPTLLGSKAKKMMSLVSGRGEVESAASSSSSSSSSSLSLRAKKNKRKLYRPEISSPMDLPSHPIISREAEEKDSDHQIIKRRLRSRMIK